MKQAAGSGYTDIAEYLIDKGAKVEKADKHGNTPLFAGKPQNDLEISRFRQS